MDTIKRGINSIKKYSKEIAFIEEFGVEFVPAENVLATLKYFDGKDISTDQDASKFFGQLELQF